MVLVVVWGEGNIVVIAMIYDSVSVRKVRSKSIADNDSRTSFLRGMIVIKNHPLLVVGKVVLLKESKMRLLYEQDFMRSKESPDNTPNLSSFIQELKIGGVCQKSPRIP